MRVKHAFASAKGDGPDATKIQPSHWNADHEITGSGITPVGAVISYDGHTVPAGWLECFGQNVSRTTYSLLFAALVKSAVVTLTIASPCIGTLIGHGFLAGSKIRFSTTGTLPTGVAIDTDYYVISAGLTSDFFRFSATPEGAAINSSGTQTGVHTVIHAPHGIGDGSTTFGIPDRRDVVDVGRGNMGGTARGLMGTWLNTTILGLFGGSGGVVLDINTMPAHNHTVSPTGSIGGGGEHAHNGVSLSGTATGQAASHTLTGAIASLSLNNAGNHAHGYGKANPTAANFASPGAGTAFKGLVYNNPLTTEDTVAGGDHNHALVSGTVGISGGITVPNLSVTVTGNIGNPIATGTHGHTLTLTANVPTSSPGGGQAHSNVQPSFVTRRIIYAGNV